MRYTVRYMARYIARYMARDGIRYRARTSWPGEQAVDVAVTTMLPAEHAAEPGALDDHHVDTHERGPERFQRSEHCRGFRAWCRVNRRGRHCGRARVDPRDGHSWCDLMASQQIAF